jgi:hypothetical protein
MKHVLQSLLMTTVLTLPTAFASDQIPGFNESTTNALATAESNPKLSITAADRYELTANQLNATPYDSLSAANRLKDLGSKYYAEVAILYEKCANHPTAKPEDILNAGMGLASLRFNAGAVWYSLGITDRAAALFELIANRKDVTPQDIIKAGEGFDSLGLTDRAAAVYELIANRKDAHIYDIRLAADKLRNLGVRLREHLTQYGVTHFNEYKYADRADALLRARRVSRY